MKSFLVVDDSEDVHYILKRYLIKEGIAITSVLNGREAMDYLCDPKNKGLVNFPPDAILLDLNMPIMNGFDFLKEYEKTNQDSDIKVIMLSSSCLESDKKMVSQFSCVKGYVSKPILKQQVAEIIKILRGL